jgi:hypothetical protein
MDGGPGERDGLEPSRRLIGGEPLTSLLRRAARRLARAYRQRCAAEDVRRLRMQVPDGVWVCARCWHVSLDRFASSWHLIATHS